MSATTIANMLALDLTARALLALDPPVAPLVAGDDWNLRLQVLDENGVAVALTGATVVATISGTTPLTRTTDVVITGATKEIAHDADQTAETGDTGKGWFALNCGASEKAVFDALTGTRKLVIVITFADTTVRTFAMGRLDILGR